MQFTHNAAQLEELDDETIDDDVSVIRLKAHKQCNWNCLVITVKMWNKIVVIV